MNFILYILVFIFVLGIVVLVHEFGHFLFARKAGILCHEFSIGMGPVLWKTKKGETTYAIRAIPIGGFVSMAGEDPETDKIKKGQVIYLKTEGNKVKSIYLYKPRDLKLTYAKVIDFDLYGKDGNSLYIHYENEEGVTNFVTVAEDAFYHFSEKLEMQIAPYDRCFESKRWLPRFLTVVAGASFNFILAVLVYIIVNLSTGVPVNQPIIGAVSENSPAAIVGIKPGDQIITINNGEKSVDVKKWEDISDILTEYKSGNIEITVRRGNENLKFTVTPEVYVATLGIYSNKELDKTIIGAIAPNSNADKAGFKSGDEIIKITGSLNDDKNTKTKENETLERSKANNNLNNWKDITDILDHFYLSEDITITVLRNGTEEKITVQAIKALEPKNVSRALVGITHKTEFSILGSIKNGFKDTYGVIASVFETFDMLFTDKNVGVGDLSGPVGIYDMTKTFAMAGLISLLSWVAFISANIGFVNLLPLPALDGGRLLFLLIEGVVRKPIDRKVEGYIHTVGFILFMILFVFVTFNDILRIRG